MARITPRSKKWKQNRLKRSKTLAVTEYGKDGEPKAKLYPLKVTMQEVIDQIDNLKPEPNMPTVDELVDIGKNGMTEKQSAEYQAWMAKQAADLQAALSEDIWNLGKGGFIGVDPASDSITPDQADALQFYLSGLTEDQKRMVKLPASDIRPKKVPTYETKPRKIDLE